MKNHTIPIIAIDVNITNSKIDSKSHYAIIAFNPVNLTIDSSESVAGAASSPSSESAAGSASSLSSKLVAGAGSSPSSEPAAEPVAEVREAESVGNQVPIVGNVAAGSPILAQECIEDYRTFDTGGRDGEYFALRVRGESMLYAGILPDDLVVVHKQDTAHNGEIVVALLEDEATVKRLSRKNGETWLLPENPDYQPIDGKYASILGKVAAVVRRY